MSNTAIRGKRLVAGVEIMHEEHFAQVLEIERMSYEAPWTIDQLVYCLAQRDHQGVVAKIERKVAGFLVYHFHKPELRIVTLAVHPGYRRKGVASQLVNYVAARIKPGLYSDLAAEICELNLSAQLFFKSCGFRCTSIMPNDDGEAPYYFFQYMP